MKVYDMITNECVEVDESTIKLYDYCNAKEEVIYNAKELDSEFWCNFKVEGTVDDIEDRLRTWNNVVKLMYANVVGFKASKNDPDRVVWRNVVEYVKQHEDEFFDINGDYLEGLVITNDMIKDIM